MLAKKIGPIVQIAYVVPDVDEAIVHWLRMGVGPFFVSRHPKYVHQTYRGKEIDCDISAAFAQSGGIQIELIQQHNDVLSAFTEYQAQHGFGVQHAGVLSEDLAADTAKLAEVGFHPFHRMVSAIGVETVFFETKLPGGTVLELIQATAAVTNGFEFIKQASVAWDGTGPSIIEF